MKKIFMKSNAFGLSLLLGNAVSFVFMLVYAVVHSGTAAADVFAVFMLATIGADMVYGLLSKSNRGLYLILGIILLITVNYAAVYIVTLPVFAKSVSVAGTVALMLIPLGSGALIISDIVKKPSELPQTESKHYRKTVSVCIVCLPISLFFVSIFAYDLVLGGNAYLNVLTANAPLLLLPFIWGASLILLRIVKERCGGLKPFIKKAPYANVIIMVIALAFLGFFAAQTSAITDNLAAKNSYTAAFGKGVFGSEDPLLRKRPYSLADDYFGIKTTGYEVRKDIVYYIGDNDNDRGLTLKYDVFYPTFESACKSVLVNIHGSGVDKEVLPQKNKYFASLGYVVYDIQMGDYNERGTNWNSAMGINYKEKSEFILKFFKYARDNNDLGANFGSVFISGMSLGGSLTLYTGLYNSEFFIQEGIVLKGIIPFYQGYWPSAKDDYLDSINADSVPCLTVMGKKDGVVTPESPYYILERYRDAGNPRAAVVWITYAGHSFDTRFTAYANQISIYFMERFMLQLR